MEETKLSEVLIFYFRNNFKKIILSFVFILVFALVFFLYNLPMEPILYGTMLCAAIATIIIIVNFSRYYRKIKTIQILKNRVTFDIDHLPKANHLLEQKYQDLIAILYQDKLHTVSEFDTAKSDLVDYFTLWAHQIKTPIAAMDLLLQSEKNKENTQLSMELFKIEEYVEMVLQYLRLGSTSSDLVLKRHDLDDIVRQAVRKYAKIFIQKKIKLEYSEIHCEALTDEKWLMFVIEQILSNALKYTREGKISIYMESDQQKVLVIEDTGIGIAPEDLPRVFEKGFTGYNGRADKKSTGIGLYLCKQILGKLSHTIAIESQVGKGTKIKIGLETVEMIFE